MAEVSTTPTRGLRQALPHAGLGGHAGARGRAPLSLRVDMTSKPNLRSTDQGPFRIPPGCCVFRAIVFFAALLALGPGGVSALAASTDDSPASAGMGGKAGTDSVQLQVFLQRRFRLPNASDVEVGPRRASPIPGLSVRTVKMHNDAGQSGVFVVYIDNSGKTAILSDVEVGSPTPGPLHGLWSRPLRPATEAPNSPAKSEL